ncbi:DUF4145 domain-containing protein [Marinomonas fungiae]|nr:DUF4145 domain-containing protein [Marinomonas fungiae]
MKTGIPQLKLRQSEFMIARCQHCSAASVWLGDFSSWTEELGSGFKVPENGEMVYPITNFGPAPSSDMPDDVKSDYLEARTIAQFSPRAACALLRLALQKLMVHLGEPGKNIDQDIRSLAKKELLSPKFIRLMDTLRLFGNDSVHPGEIREEDIGENIDKMFLVLNKIVEGAITDQKMFDELYLMTSENKRASAEAKDLKSRESKVSGDK